MDIFERFTRIRHALLKPDTYQPFNIREAVVPFGVALVVVVYLLACLHAGQPLNEDYAVYLQQAWNIGHHAAMRDVGVIYLVDPAQPLSRQAPLTYPPLLPLLYAIPVLWAGFDLEFFKHLQLAILALGLVAAGWAMLSWNFGKLAVSASLLLFGLCAETSRAINDLGTDIPFLLFLFLALMAIEEFVRAPKQSRTHWGIVCGLAIFLAMKMRTVGVALIPTVIVADFVTSGWQVRLKGFLPVAFAIGLSLLTSQLLGDASGYGFVADHIFFEVSGNLKQFYWALVTPWQTVPFEWAIELFYVLTLLVASIGVMRDALRGKAVALFALFYAGMLLVLPNFDAGARYLIPLLLLHGAFFIRGMSTVGEWLAVNSKLARFASVGATALLALLMLLQRPPFPAGPLGFGVETAAAQSTFGFIRSSTPTTSVVAFSKYRSLHLFTQRVTIKPTVSSLESVADILNWSKNYHVNYFVLKYSPSVSRFDFSDCPQSPLCGRDAVSPNFALVFRNSDFEVFRVLGSQ